MSGSKRDGKNPPGASAAPTPPSTEPPKLLKFTRGRSRPAPTPDPIPFMFPGGDISLMVGAPGSGKTALYSEWIARFQEGRAILGHKPGKISAIGVVFSDRQWHTARHWLDVAGVKVKATKEDVETGHAKEECLDGIPHYAIKDDDTFQWSKLKQSANHLKLLTDSIEMLWEGTPPEESLVIVDPLSPFMGGRLNDYSAVAAAIGPISQWCMRKRITILGTHHTSKLKGDKKDRYVRPQDRVLGSTALTGYTNTQFFVVGPEETEQPWHLVGYATHNIPSAEFQFKKNSKGLFIPYSPKMAQVMTPVDPVEERERKLLLDEIPVTGQISTIEIIRRTNIKLAWSTATTERKLRDLLVKQLVIQPARGKWRKVKNAPVPEGEE